MKRNNIALCLFVSFFALAISSFFCDIPQRIIVAISVSSLLYTSSQTIKSYMELKNEDAKTQVDTVNTVGNFNLTPAMLLFMKRYFTDFNQSKKEKWLHRATVALDCLSFVVLIFGCVVPIPFLENETIGNFSTLLSFAFLFLSMWQVEKYSNRRGQWEEIQLLCLATNSHTQDIVQEDRSYADA